MVLVAQKNGIEELGTMEISGLPDSRKRPSLRGEAPDQVPCARLQSS